MGKQIFIDKFFVPAESVEEFVHRMNYNRKFLRKFGGFVTDHAYKQIDEQGNTTFITVAIWESLDAIHKAKDSVQEEYKRIRFNMPEFLNTHDIKIERGIYQEIND